MFVALCPKATLTPHLACLQMLTLARPHRTEQPDGQTEEGTDELARVLLQHPTLRVRVMLGAAHASGWMGGWLGAWTAGALPGAACQVLLPAILAGWVGWCTGRGLLLQHPALLMSSFKQLAQELRSGWRKAAEPSCNRRAVRADHPVMRCSRRSAPSAAQQVGTVAVQGTLSHGALYWQQSSRALPCAASRHGGSARNPFTRRIALTTVPPAAPCLAQQVNIVAVQGRGLHLSIHTLRFVLALSQAAPRLTVQTVDTWDSGALPVLF